MTDTVENVISKNNVRGLMQTRQFFVAVLVGGIYVVAGADTPALPLPSISKRIEDKGGRIGTEKGKDGGYSLGGKNRMGPNQVDGDP